MTSVRARLDTDGDVAGMNVNHIIRDLRREKRGFYTYDRRDGTARDAITPVLISVVRRWLVGRFGLAPVLVVERAPCGATRVALRLVADSRIYEGEVAALNRLRRQYPEACKERLFALLVECAV